LHLHGSTGFDQTIPIAKFFPNPDQNTVDLHFANVPTAGNYTLSYIAADGSERTVVKSTSFQKLQDVPQTAQNPSS
jgi:hypothetical protein